MQQREWGFYEHMGETMIPRIQGKVGQAESEDPKINNKWFFEMWLTTIGGGDGESLGQFGPWDTEAIAKSELEKAAQMCCEHLVSKIIGAVPGKYIDMKDNKLKKWKK